MIEPPAGAVPKDEFRAWARAARAQVDWPETSRRVVAGLLRWEPLRLADTVLVFLPMPLEVDLNPLLEAAPVRRFVTTRTPDDRGTLSIHELGGPLEVHRLGFLQPHARAPRVAPTDVDVFLLPGLAFDLWGNRLGRGAGYFDELLSHARSNATRVGVVPVSLVVDRLPTGPGDVIVRYLATEEGVLAVAS